MWLVPGDTHVPRRHLAWTVLGNVPYVDLAGARVHERGGWCLTGRKPKFAIHVAHSGCAPFLLPFLVQCVECSIVLRRVCVRGP